MLPHHESPGMLFPQTRLERGGARGITIAVRPTGPPRTKLGAFRFAFVGSMPKITKAPRTVASIATKALTASLFFHGEGDFVEAMAGLSGPAAFLLGQDQRA